MAVLRSDVVAATEGAASVDFVVRLDSAAATDVQVAYRLLGASAAAAQDFNNQSGTLTIAAGASHATLTVVLRDDGLVEPTELFWLEITGATGADIGQRLTPALLFDNDAPAVAAPQVFVDDVTVDEASGRASFVVRLDREAAGPVSVAYSTAGGSAVADSDFSATSGVLSFAAGERVRVVSVPIVDDDSAERDETFELRLSDLVGAQAGDLRAQALIGANDALASGPTLISATATTVVEDRSWAEFVVQLSAPATAAVSVDYRAVAASASDRGDFLAQAGTLTFAPGDTTASVRIVLADDSGLEPTEAFWLELTHPVGGLVAQRWTLATLLDNDRPVEAAPTVTVGDAIVDESAGLASFPVRLSAASAVAITVGFTTHDDTALAGSDYIATSGSLSFAPGQLLQWISVPLIDDRLTEFDESFEVELTSAEGARRSGAPAAGQIPANDGAPAALPDLSARAVRVREGDFSASFLIELSAPSTQPVSVFYQIDGVEARADRNDFEAQAATLVFAPGQTSRVVQVLLGDNSTAEGVESFRLNLTTAVNARIVQQYTTGSIVDDDVDATVFGGGLGNDRYTVANALDQVVEAPGGGVDVVFASVTYALPDDVEQLVLTGSGPSNGTGNAGDNVLRGSASDNVLDGLGGIDTVVYAGRESQTTITLADDVVTVLGAASGSDTLQHIERLQFDDVLLATDTGPDGHVAQARLMFNAAFDRAPSLGEWSRWTAQLDRAGSPEGLAQAMINAYAPGIGDEALVRHLWATVMEQPLPEADLQQFLGSLASGSLTQAGLLALAAASLPNAEEVAGLIGQVVVLDPSWFPLPPVGG